MNVPYEMIPCSGFIEEVQNVRTSTRCVPKVSSCAATLCGVVETKIL